MGEKIADIGLPRDADGRGIPFGTVDMRKGIPDRIHRLRGEGR